MSLSGKWIKSFGDDVLREVVESRARDRMTREEDMKIFEAIGAKVIVPPGAWVKTLSAGDTVWLIELNKWATVVSPWDDGRIGLAYDHHTHLWFVSEHGRGLDGRLILKEYTRARELPLGHVNLAEVRSMIMVDVGKEWRDVVTLLRDPMEVEGVDVGGRVWSAQGHSGDDEVEIVLIYETPAVDYTGKSGEKIRIEAKLSLWMHLKGERYGSYTWDISQFVKEYGVNTFKAAEAMVMVSLCEDPMTAVYESPWGILSADHPSLHKP